MENYAESPGSSSNFGCRFSVPEAWVGYDEAKYILEMDVPPNGWVPVLHSFLCVIDRRYQF